MSILSPIEKIMGPISLFVYGKKIFSDFLPRVEFGGFYHLSSDTNIIVFGLKLTKKIGGYVLQ